MGGVPFPVSIYGIYIHIYIYIYLSVAFGSRVFLAQLSLLAHRALYLDIACLRASSCSVQSLHFHIRCLSYHCSARRSRWRLQADVQMPPGGRRFGHGRQAPAARNQRAFIEGQYRALEPCFCGAVGVTKRDSPTGHSYCLNPSCRRSRANKRRHHFERLRVRQEQQALQRELQAEHLRALQLERQLHTLHERQSTRSRSPTRPSSVKQEAKEETPPESPRPSSSKQREESLVPRTPESPPPESLRPVPVAWPLPGCLAPVAWPKSPPTAQLVGRLLPSRLLPRLRGYFREQVPCTEEQ